MIPLPIECEEEEESEEQGWSQCDQKKSLNVYKSCPKIIDFDTFTKNAWECERFGQINCCQRQ